MPIPRADQHTVYSNASSRDSHEDCGSESDTELKAFSFSDNELDDPDDSMSEVSEGQDYKSTTQNQIDRVGHLWYRYSKERYPDPIKALQTADSRSLSLFLNWSLRVKKGKNGRRLVSTKKKSSFITRWKFFRLFYEQSTKSKVDPSLKRAVCRAARTIATRHQLSDDKKEKPLMMVETLVRVVETALRTTTKRFALGVQRVQLCLFLHLAGYTVNRPTAVLNLKYKNVRLTLIRDTNGGPHVPVLEFKFDETKTYLGPKDANTFSIPEIIFDPTLILSPHILFRKAFQNPEIKSLETLTQLEMDPRTNQLPIPLRSEIKEDYIFCETKMVHSKPCLNHGKRLLSINPWLESIGKLTGLLHVLSGYALRYGGGNVLNEDPSIGDAQRNIILMHRDTRTFLKHYLSNRINSDTAAIFRGSKPQSQIMRQTVGMGRWIDPRRPTQLSDIEKGLLRTTPEYLKLKSELESTRKLLDHDGQASKDEQQRLRQKCDRLKKALNNLRSHLMRRRLKQIRSDFDDEQAVIDMSNQLSNRRVTTPKVEIPKEEPMPSEQAELVRDVMTLPSSMLIEDEIRRRSTAAEAVRKYCGFEEGGTRRGPKSKNSGNLETIISKHDTTRLDQALDLLRIQRQGEPCFQCGKTFNRRHDVNRHFTNTHAKEKYQGEFYRCNACRLLFPKQGMWLRHACDAHCTMTRLQQ